MSKLEQKLWICHPEPDVYPEAESHIVEYKGNGCPEHQIAGGCTMPMKSYKALIDEQVLAGLDLFMKDMSGYDFNDIEIKDHYSFVQDALKESRRYCLAILNTNPTKK